MQYKDGDGDGCIAAKDLRDKDIVKGVSDLSPWVRCPLKLVGTFKKYHKTWIEFRVPQNIVQLLRLDKREFMNWGYDLLRIKVNFDYTDRNGYFRETLKYREGYSVKEGAYLFVQFLAEPMWMPQNYAELPDFLRSDIYYWLLVCNRLSSDLNLNLKEIKHIIVTYLVKLY